MSLVKVKVNLKLCHYRPFRLQEAEGRRTSGQTTQESGKVVSPTHCPPLPKEDSGKGKGKAMPLQALQTPGG